MRLHYSPASPYVRKVLVTAHETGLITHLGLAPVAVSPIAPASAVTADNPLGKIPCLVTDEGEALYDSRVICEYLDSRHTGHKLFPHEGPTRWVALRRQTLADGMCDAAILYRYETFLRPEALQWQDWLAGQKRKIQRALDQLEHETPSFPTLPDIGVIAIGVALGYQDFRFPQDDWRSTRPKLAYWYAGFAERPSMQATLPPAP